MRTTEMLNDVWAQFVALLVLMALSVDSLNPIKAISGFIGMESHWWGIVYLATMLGLLWTHLHEAIYRSIRVYLHSILSISFKSIEVVGLENVPRDGPVIFTGNHRNQFVDGLVVLMTAPRKLGFLIAEKSYHKPVIGDLSRIMGCIPVVRPQDSVVSGVGNVKNADDSTESENYVIGQDTKFTSQLESGDQIRLSGKTVKDSGSPVKVVKVIDDTHIITSAPLRDADDNVVTSLVDFGVFKKVDQSVTFAKVYQHLQRGQCIGIFPEGGSHDRTDLLPLKAGVAVMALGVKAKHNINAHVVPVGLNYFRGHRFRGRVTVEFGTPITVGDELVKKYEEDQRSACNEFLHHVEEGMRSVIVTAPNYHILRLVMSARRLFQRSGVRLTAEETQDLNRRFAEGYKILSTIPEASDDLAKLERQVDDYDQSLNLMGLRDHQVPFIAWWSIHDVLGSALYGLLIFLLASIPLFVLNAPVGLMARYVANAEQKKALEGSKVKLEGKDVVLSKKITFSMVAVPVLWALYLILAALLTDWYWSSIFLLFCSFPLFSVFGIRSVEAGMIELKTVRPLFYRLLPKYRAIQDKLPKQRAELQKDIRTFVHKYHDYLGPLVSHKKIDWFEYMRSRGQQDTLASPSTSNEATGEQHAEDSSDAKMVSRSTSMSSAAEEQAARNDESHSSTQKDEEKEKMIDTTPHGPPAMITADHDISFLTKSDKSVSDLAGLERSMSCPPGYEEALEKYRSRQSMGSN